MSSAMNSPHDESVGASGAIFGLIGTYIGVLVVNYHAMRNAKMARCMMVCMIIMLVLLNLLFSLSISGGINAKTGKNNVDNWAHFGGFIAGTCGSFAFLNPLFQKPRGQYEMWVRIVGLSGLALLGGLLLIPVFQNNWLE